MTQQTAGSPIRASSLYVGDLAPEVKEEQLYQIFESTGHVLSLRVCRDRNTEHSLGYAYVNYASPEEAEHALDTLNFSEIAGRPCRIMWQIKDPSLRRSGKGNLFVKNLADDLDNKSLYDAFSLYGAILSCKVSCDPKTNKSLNFGYVHFEKEEDSEKAIAELNGKPLNGKNIIIEKYNPNKHAKSDNEWTNCFVKNICREWTEDKLKTIFSECGAIQNAYIAKDQDNKSKGFGFINFETHEAAEKAVNEINDKVYEDNLVDGQAVALSVCRHMKKAEREKYVSEQFLKKKEERQEKTQGMNLYVKNIPDEYDDKALVELFSKFGTITSAVVMKDSEGKSRGFGFVCFSSSEEANKAISELTGKNIGNKPLYVTLAQKKEDRRQQMQAALARSVPRNITYNNPSYPVYYNSFMPNQVVMPVMPNNMNMYGQIPANHNNRRFVRKTNYGKYNNSQRNMPMRNNMPMNPAMIMPMAAAPVAPIQAPVSNMSAEQNEKINKVLSVMKTMEPISLEQAQVMSIDARRNFIGERLYGLISTIQPERVAKITGMMLELELDTLIKILNNPTELVSKVDEAVTVLTQSQ